MSAVPTTPPPRLHPFDAWAFARILSSSLSTGEIEAMSAEHRDAARAIQATPPESRAVAFAAIFDCKYGADARTRATEELLRYDADSPTPDPPTADVLGSPLRIFNGIPRSTRISDEEMGLFEMAAIKEAQTKWLWPHRVAESAMTLLAGDGGLGKSQLMLYIAERLSNEGEWCDGSGRAPLGRTVIVSAEDDPGSTIKPRLMAIGANQKLITMLKAKIRIERPGKPPLVSPASLRDTDYWEEALDRRPDTKLLIIDPLPSYLGRGANDSKNSELREILEPFIDRVVRSRGIALLCNSHLNKSSDSRNPVNRILGSVGYVNLARIVHMIIKDPNDARRRYFALAKCNITSDETKAVSFHIESRTVDSEAGPIETSALVFDDQTTELDLTDVMSAEHTAGKRGRPPVDSTKLAVFLVELLRDKGPTYLTAIADAAGAAGHLGKQVVDASNGRARWSGFNNLYRGLDMVPRLPAPHEGWSIANSKDDPSLRSANNRARWALRPKA